MILLVGGYQIPAGSGAWYQFNNAGTGGAQPTGTTLGLLQTRCLLDTTAGPCDVTFPADPIDGATIYFKDGSTTGYWATRAGQATPNSGQLVETIGSPGTFSSSTVLLSTGGGCYGYSWSAALGAWLLLFAPGS